MICNTNEATKDPQFGILPCLDCRNKQKSISFKNIVEFTSPSIKEQRKQFESDIIQPYRGGELSKEYVRAHGTKAIGATPQEVKKARNVWRENRYYKDE